MHGNTRHVRLIADKRPQLSKRPGMECCALRPSSPHPRANMGQIFNRYRALCAFGLRNHPFRQDMVHIFCKPLFLTGKYPQPAAAAFGALLLELGSESSVAIPNVLDRVARMRFAIRVNGNVRHAHVDTQHALNIYRIGCIGIADGKQIPLPTHEGQIGFAMLTGQQGPLARSTHKRDRLPFVQCPDRHRRIRQCIGKDTIIIGNRRCWAKRPLHLPIPLVGIRNLRNTADDHLCAKTKLFPYRRIAALLERELAERAAIPRNLTDKGAGGVRPFKRLHQQQRLFWRGLKFQLCGYLHKVKYTTVRTFVQMSLKRAEASILPTTKAGGLPALKGNHL